MNSQSWISDEDRLLVFVDFLGSAEWIFPVQSFIDYYCVVFATEDLQEHLAEKSRVYSEYKSIVGSNLNQFLTSVMDIDAAGLVALMSMYNGDYQCLEYVLAVEDYGIFHTFMFETNKDLDQQVKDQHQKPKQQATQYGLAPISEEDEELIALMRPDTARTAAVKGTKTEEQMLAEAIR